MSAIKEGILSPQHVQSFLETSAGYLGRRPEANQPAQENGPFAGSLDAAGCRGSGERARPPEQRVDSGLA